MVEAELGWPQSRLVIENDAGEQRTVRTRWVLDASGRQTFLSRKLKLWHKTVEHPTAAIWARFTGSRISTGPRWWAPTRAAPSCPKSAWPAGSPPTISATTASGAGRSRSRTARPRSAWSTTRSFSIRRATAARQEGSLREKFLRFLASRPGLRELTENAKIVQHEWGDDFMALSHLPYHSDKYMDKGWALVADAASFLDPYYSPGLDHASMSIYATARIIEKDLKGERDEAMLASRIAVHNGNFTRAYRRWIEAIYLGKYEVMGDADLLGASFLIDTALYYMAVVTPVYKNLENIANPAFGVDLPQATLAYRSMKAINDRLVVLARQRRARGTAAPTNVNVHRFSRAFGFGIWVNMGNLLRGIRIWMKVELQCLGHRLRYGRVDTSRPVKEQPAAAGKVPKMETSPGPA